MASTMMGGTLASDSQIADVVNQWPHVLETMYALTKAADKQLPGDSDVQVAKTHMAAIDSARFTFP